MASFEVHGPFKINFEKRPGGRTLDFDGFWDGDNKHKYHNGFSDYARGTPMMYFVVHPSQRGRTHAKHIKEIEDFLIQAGVAKNPSFRSGVNGRW